jgi:hypothetical protein
MSYEEPRSADRSDNFKRLRLRAFLWTAGLTILILLDEFIKEGYLAKLEDFLKPGTHESLLMALWIGFLAFLTWKRRKRNGNGSGSERESGRGRNS